MMNTETIIKAKTDAVEHLNDIFASIREIKNQATPANLGSLETSNPIWRAADAIEQSLDAALSILDDIDDGGEPTKD